MNKYSSRGVILKSYNIMNKWCSKRLKTMEMENEKKKTPSTCIIKWLEHNDYLICEKTA